MANLNTLREAIDGLDDQIMELLNRRALLVQKVGKIKTEGRQDLYVPSREREIFERLERTNPGPFPTESVFRVFREIISASLALEHPMRIVYLGPQATFTHGAALNLFGHSANLNPEKSVRTVFEEVERGRAQYGVVPVENSNEGAVTHTLDMFTESNLKIIAESYLDVSHDLLSKSGKLAEVQRIYSHPQALEQCRRWLENNCPKAQLVEVSSTARAAQMVTEETHAAAIASGAAAELYQLKVIAAKIEDNANNRTRFLVIGKKTPKPTGKDKTSIMFRFKDEPGILGRMLEPFGKRNLNLAKIESRPVKRRAWEYVFFLDIEGHLQDEAMAAAIEELREFCKMVKLLGSYPRSR